MDDPSASSLRSGGAGVRISCAPVLIGMLAPEPDWTGGGGRLPSSLIGRGDSDRSCEGGGGSWERDGVDPDDVVGEGGRLS